MDIRKLVNNQGQAHIAQAPMTGRDWPAHQTSLPPLSAMFPDPAYAASGFHNYPMPPHGEGYTSYQFAAYQQPQQPIFASHQPQYAVAPPTARPDMPYMSSASTLRSSSSAISVSSTKYASSNGSGPATSAERRSLSDEDEEGDDSDEDMSGGSTPLPPYYAHGAQTQALSFLEPTSQTSSVDGMDFACEDCGVTYSRAPDLRRHKASVHNDRESREKVAATFPCDVCGQVLLSSHGYQGHMRRHYDERPFVCEAPYCGKAFHDSATLARHRRTHSTEHKFECDFCGRRFKRKDNLNTHRKKHQVGGESINPNLLRKPVTRVSNGGDSPPAPAYEPTPMPPSQAFVTPPYNPPPMSTTGFAPYPQQAPPQYYQQPQMYAQPQHQRYMVKAEDLGADPTMFAARTRMMGIPPAAR